MALRVAAFILGPTLHYLETGVFKKSDLRPISKRQRGKLVKRELQDRSALFQAVSC